MGKTSPNAACGDEPAVTGGSGVRLMGIAQVHDLTRSASLCFTRLSLLSPDL